MRMSISRRTSGPSQRKGSSTSRDLLADPPHQQPLQLLHLVAGDEVPERAAEAGAGAVPAVLLGEAVVALVDLDQVVLVVDRVAERLSPDRSRRLSCGARGDGVGAPSSASRALRDRHRHAGEDRRLALGVLARLGRAQLLDQVEELAGVVALEGDDELLVVEAEGVGGVDRDLRIAAADLDVAFHDPAALLRRQAVPAALLDHRVEEQVLALGDADLRPRLLVGVGRAFGHREERVGRLGPFRQAALAEHDVEGVQVVEVRALAEQDQVDVAARSYG